MKKNSIHDTGEKLNIAAMLDEGSSMKMPTNQRFSETCRKCSLEYNTHVDIQSR